MLLNTLSPLYDLDALIDVDSTEENIIIVNDVAVFLGGFGSSKPYISSYITKHVKKPISGEVYLITNKFLTQKLYVLYIEDCGHSWVKVLQFIDMDNGNEAKYTLTKGDYDVLKSYPVFKTDTDLGFFLAAQEYPNNQLGYNTDSNSVSSAMNNMNSFLKEGLWLIQLSIAADPNTIKSAFILDGITDIQSTDNRGEYTALYKNQKIILQQAILDKPGNELYFFIVGPYQALKSIYCGAVTNWEEKKEDTAIFGAGLFYDTENVMPLLSQYNKLIGNNEPSPIPVTKPVKKDKPMDTPSITEPATKSNFWDDAEKTINEAIKEEGKKKKKKRVQDFKVTAEISVAEQEVAKEEVTAQKPKKVTVKGKKYRSLTGEINQAIKEKQIIDNPSFSYPTDWDYIYTLKECSDRYNSTIGFRYNRALKKWETDETQLNGMTVAEWNAYFTAHPEYAHLIDAATSHIGGITMTEEELRESGHLLYNPKTTKLEYLHDYLKGNGYTLLDELEAARDAVEQLYGVAFYQKQVEAIKTALPEIKSIDSPVPELVPFIHPLDEVVIKFEVNTAANMTYRKSVNNKIMRDANNAIKSNPNANIDIEALGQELQSLSISIFFQTWLGTQYGRLAGYNLPNIDIVTSMYFRGMSMQAFLREYHFYQFKFDEVPTESEYYEVKDNVKRFVNDLFQEFIKTEITQDDRSRIDFEWNKRYNGFIPLNIYKYPVFIRHSKYFKDRSKAKLLELTETQIEGTKFASINNGSIIAHEVGFGKTLISIGYMSHCFETNQANNIMVLVPKSLYVNKKWKEEAVGNFDEKRNKFILGAIPQYNLIEMGNFTPTSIFEERLDNEERQYKNYSDNDVNRIQKYDQLLVEIGGGSGLKYRTKRPGTATIPASPYQYRMAVVASNTSWTKIVDILQKMDKPLFDRCQGSEGEKIMTLLNHFANFDIGSNAKEKKENIVKLSYKLSEIYFYYESWLPRFGSLPMDLVANPDENKNYLDFFDAQTMGYAFERDASGKLERDEENKKIPRAFMKVAEQYVLEVLEDIHGWLANILTKMYGYGIYEYGTWKFAQKQHNIILATRDSLQWLGFSALSKEDVKRVVSEITEYKHEVEYDADRVESVVYTDTQGVTQVFKRNPETVLQKQLAFLMGKIESLMTEEGDRGKFLLENLKIDGFILDEAHIAKKVFTNVKTSSSVTLIGETGSALKINTSAHDIKGASASDIALRVFGVCQYIRSLGTGKPIMLLTATPFSNQPTEIFTMLSMVGIKQLREQGISNIKNFFDLFLKETLKYDFDHKGEFIKRISVEDFRNKSILLNVIWSVIDIKREASLEKAALLQKEKDDRESEFRPTKIVFPKLMSETSKEYIETVDNVKGGKGIDSGLTECEMYGNINTVAVVNRMSVNTSSIVDRNEIQKQMMDDIEKVITNTPNPNKPALDKNNKQIMDIVNGKEVPRFRSYSFDDICPNAALFAELEGDKDADEADKRKNKKSFKVEEAIKVSKNDDYGKVFKALGLSRSIALSPYLFGCNELPEPTPENLIKYSPKLEYLVKALESVKNHHTQVIPKKIKDVEANIARLKAKDKLNEFEKSRLKEDSKILLHLQSATEVSGQVVYFNILRFQYFYKDAKGKAQVKEYNVADLVKEYLVKKGIFEANEIGIYSSDTSKDNKEHYIKDFQDGKIKVFIGTPSMREGVDLQNKATTLYVMTPDWNPTDMRQIEGRIWRRDNENKFVRVVYVLLDQSIEVFIYAKLEEKARRLQQIMKERNTIVELEEMSLDPNQTKVALASDPEKRADIVTKLCEIILVEQRSKIARSLTELRKMADKLDSIYEAVELVKDTYLIPFYEAYPIIAKKVEDFKRKKIIETFVNDKPAFLEDFSNKYSSAKITDPALPMALELIYWGENRDRTLNFAKTYSPETIADILIGLKNIIENKEVFSSYGDFHYNENVSAYKNMHPTMFSRTSYEMNQAYTFLFSEAGSYKKYEGSSVTGIRLFEGMRVLGMPDNIQAVILKEVKKLSERAGTVGRQIIVDALDSLADKVVRMLTDYVNTNPQVRPENHVDYIKAGSQFINIGSIEEFDQADLFGKIQMVNDASAKITGTALNIYSSMGADKKKKINEGTNEVPTMAELVPILGLQEKPKTGEANALTKMVAPIADLTYVMKNIKENFLIQRGLTINELPDLLLKFEQDHITINNKIDSLKVTKQRLIEKFKKVAEERKSISIDQIVAKFAESNTYLETKMSYGLK